MTGPTTTGSIDAKLTIDKSAWDRSVAEAKAEARELGALSPTVKIDANVGPALAKMAELEAVERQLADTNVRLAAAEQIVNREQAQSATTAGRLAAVEKLLAEAHQAAAEQAAKQAVSTEAAAAATDAAGDAAGRAAVKVSTVAVAEGRLETAQRQAANSASVAYIANERLNAMREKGGVSALQMAAAEEAVARAERNAEAAEKKHLAAIVALNAAKSAAAAKSLELAAATDTEAAASNNAVASNNRRVSGLQVLLGLAPAILAAAAPIAGAAVGLAAGFGVMGVSGVLALKGIKDAMVVGDGVGNTYAVGLQGLKGDLNALAGTSANAMLSSFNQVVGDINTRMPYLTSLIGTGSMALGQMGGTALRGVLDGLKTMNPLLEAGQVELGKFVTWLFSFNGTDGFKSFIGYSMDNLPSVMHLLENLVITAGHILAAFAPLGPVMITLLTGLTDGLNALPLPVLAGLVTTATLLGPALRVAFAPGVAGLIISVAEAIGFTGVMANLAVPVVGVLTALIAGVGIAAATASLGTGTGTAALRDYTQALKDDSLAIGEHVKAQVAKELVDSGAAEAGQRLGLSLMTVQQAALGNVTAIQAVKNVTDDAAKGIIDWTSGGAYASEQNKRLSADVDLMRGSVIGASGAIIDQLDKQKLLNEMLHPTTEAMGAQSTAAGIQAYQFGTNVAALQAAKDGQDKTAQSTADATLKMQLQNDAAGILKMTLDGLNGKAISAAQAQNSFDSSLANMGDHVDKVGKKITFTTTNIGDMSAASVALRGQLNTQVSGLQAVVAANGGLDDSTGKAREQMEAMRTQIIDNAVAHGVDKDAVTAYVDNLLTIPKSVPPTKLDVDTAQALANIETFKWHLANIQDRIVTVTERTLKDPVGMGSSIGGRENGSLAGGQALGGFVPEYWATGGMAGASYLAGGGFPGGPRGTDTVPTWLTPGEFTMKRASARSIGPAALNYMNATGQLPPQQQDKQGAGGVHVDQINIYDQHDPVGTSMDVQRRLAMIAT